MTKRLVADKTLERLFAGVDERVHLQPVLVGARLAAHVALQRVDQPVQLPMFGVGGAAGELHAAVAALKVAGNVDVVFVLSVMLDAVVLVRVDGHIVPVDEASESG